MLISKNWLKKYIPEIEKFDSLQIAKELTTKVAEVEQIIELREDISKIVVATITAVEKHPNADKLSVCQVNAGPMGNMQVVCGAPNVAVGMKAALSLVGGRVYSSSTKSIGNTMEVVETDIRGVKSTGMLCSERELGLNDNHETILDLTETKFTPGEEFDDVIRDTVFEIENKSLTHRGDCFSHQGIARELSAILNIGFTPFNVQFNSSQTASLPIEIRVETQKCGYFAVVTIKGAKVSESPFWLKLELGNIGVDSINNVVDLANYVMYDIGQPLHTYDYEKIADNKITVREARDGERYVGIDEKEYTLNKGEVVITDNKSIQGLAGILGAKGSEITDETEDIVIEAARFDNYAVLAAARKNGIRSEAAIRFSKNVDPQITRKALENIVNLITDITGGELSSEIVEIEAVAVEKDPIKIDLKDVSRVVGVEIKPQKSIATLEKLGFTVNEKSDINTNDISVNAPVEVNVIAPSWRFDTRIAEDLIEEIARIYGYDLIEPQLPARKTAAVKIPDISELKRAISNILLRLGMDEQINYSFISESMRANLGIDENNMLKIINAISPELNWVRSSILPGLMKGAKLNTEVNSMRNFSIFEIGRVVDKNSEIEKDIPSQPWTLGMLSTTDEDRYLEFKSQIETVFEGLEVNYSWQEIGAGNNAINNPFGKDVLHKGRSAGLFVKSNDENSTAENIGFLGELGRAKTYEMFGLDKRIVMMEVNLEKLLPHWLKRESSYKNVSTLPESYRDISYWIGDDFKIGDFLTYLEEQNSIGKISSSDKVDLEFKLIDEYTAEKQRSMTIRIVMKPRHSTLIDQKINSINEEIEQLVKAKYKLQIR